MDQKKSDILVYDLTQEAYRIYKNLHDDGKVWKDIKRSYPDWIELADKKRVEETRDDIYGSNCTQYEKILGPKGETLVTIKSELEGKNSFQVLKIQTS